MTSARGILRLLGKIPQPCVETLEIRRNLRPWTRHPPCSMIPYGVALLTHYTCQKPRFSSSMMKP